MHYTFIGMPGAGKSHVGKAFAVLHNMACIDIDTLLEEQFDKPLPSILADLGDEGFLAAEDTVVENLTLSKPTVLSPGGSIIYAAKAMQFLKQNTHIVYLEVPFSVIVNRVEETPRGIVGGGERTMEDIYAERTPHYKKWADQTVVCEGKTVAEIMGEITVSDS